MERKMQEETFGFIDALRAEELELNEFFSALSQVALTHKGIPVQKRDVVSGLIQEAANQHKKIVDRQKAGQSQEPTPKASMEVEYDSWLVSQINHLRDREFEELDVINLVEELEALVRGEKSAIESFAYQIVLHLLLIEYWSEESEWSRRHWRSQVESFQFQLNNRLTTNLKKHLSDPLDFIYAKARKNATVKTGLPDRFPKQIPYSLSQILGELND